MSPVVPQRFRGQPDNSDVAEIRPDVRLDAPRPILAVDSLTFVLAYSRRTSSSSPHVILSTLALIASRVPSCQDAVAHSLGVVNVGGDDF